MKKKAKVTQVATTIENTMPKKWRVVFFCLQLINGITPKEIEKATRKTKAGVVTAQTIKRWRTHKHINPRIDTVQKVLIAYGHELIPQPMNMFDAKAAKYKETKETPTYIN